MKATRLALSALILVSVGVNAGWVPSIPWRKTANQAPVVEQVEATSAASTDETTQAAKGIVARIKSLPGVAWQKCPSKAALREALRWQNIKEKASEATSAVKTQIKNHPRIAAGIVAGFLGSYIVMRVIKNKRAAEQRKKLRAPFN